MVLLPPGLISNSQFRPVSMFDAQKMKQAMGFPVEMFPVLFAIPRTAGWLAQWEELLQDPEQRINRPRQIYDGCDARGYVPLSDSGILPDEAQRAPDDEGGSPPATRDALASSGRAHG